MDNFIFDHSEEGCFYSDPEFEIKFYNKNIQLLNLKQKYPDIAILSINQKHTTLIAKDNHNLEICDGYSTLKSLTAVAIRTADCLPLIAIDLEEKKISSLHCGRKGLVDGILKSFKEISQPDHPHVFFIGPHIRFYEVGEEIYSEYKTKNFNGLYTEGKKFFFSLKVFTEDYLRTHFKRIKIYDCNVDTYKDNNYWSYRKDNKTSLRNLSLGFKKAKTNEL